MRPKQQQTVYVDGTERVDEAVVEATDGGTLSLTDAGGAVQGTYAGKLHIYRKADGNTYWIVNELGMEDYLCGVVPGRCLHPLHRKH